MSENLSKKFSQIYEFKENNQYFDKILSFSPIVVSPLKRNIKDLMALFPQWKSLNYINFFVDKLLIETIKQVWIFCISIFIKNGLDKLGLILVEKYQSDNNNINQLLSSKSLSRETINRRLNSIPLDICHSHLIAFFSKNRCQIVRAYVMKMPFSEMVFQKCNDETNEFLADKKKLVKALKKYNPNHQKKANIQTYLEGFFRLILMNSFKVKSDWRLLCDVPQKDINRRAYKNRKKFLFQALENQYGVREENDISLFLWELFVPIYQEYRLTNLDSTNKGKKWITPNLLVFQKAAQEFNQQKQILINISDCVKKSSDLTETDVEKLMLKCIESLRNSEKSQSLPNISYEEIEENFGDSSKLIESGKRELLEDLIKTESDKEYKQKYQNLFYEIAWIEKIVLQKMRTKIPPNMREAVILLGYKYLPLSIKTLTQQELAQEILLNKKAHTTIGRFFIRFEEIFQQQLFQILNLDFKDKEKLRLLIQEYYSHKWKGILNLILVSNFSKESRELLRRRFTESQCFIEQEKNRLDDRQFIYNFENFMIDSYHFNFNKYQQSLLKTVTNLFKILD